MFLGPQHFQQAERHAEMRHAGILRALRPLHHGVLRLELDGRALSGGDVALVAVEAVLPDGTAIATLTPDDLPLARPVAEAFAGARTDRVGVWLALPIASDGAVAVSDEGVHQGRHTRYRRRAGSLPDSSPGGGERDVALAVPNLRLLFEHEPRDGHTALRVAEIVRAPAGGYAIADDYAPPCLRLGASAVLAGTVRRVAEILVARSGEMAAHRRSRTQGLVEFSVSELANFLMLLTVNGHLPRLLHQLQSGAAHPEDVFLGLATLAGELMTLSDEGHPKDLPPYDHDRPATAFSAIEGRLRQLLQVVIPTRYLPINVLPASERVHAGTIPEQATEGARFYLAVISALPAERVLRDIPLKAKVASHGSIDRLIAQALPGIKLTYLAVPPQEIPVQPGGVYFQLEPQGAEWLAALKTRSLAIYLPPEFTDARTEFLAVRE
jgi:type VI secretion system protein ImpJ